MYLASHALVGGVLGSVTENPFLAFLLGFISHFILDVIPHEINQKEEITRGELVWLILDFIALAFILVFIIRPELDINNSFLWGAFGGMLPDLLDNFPVWQEKFRQNRIGAIMHDFHEKIQKKTVSFIFSFIIQIFIIVIFTSIYVLNK